MRTRRLDGGFVAAALAGVAARSPSNQPATEIAKATQTAFEAEMVAIDEEEERATRPGG